MGIVLSKLGRKQEAIAGTVLAGRLEFRGNSGGIQGQIFSPSFAHIYAHIFKGMVLGSNAALCGAEPVPLRIRA